MNEASSMAVERGAESEVIWERGNEDKKEKPVMEERRGIGDEKKPVMKERRGGK